MKIKYTIWGVLAGTAGLILTSCEEKGLLVSSNDTAYLRCRLICMYCLQIVR
jgi:hypothetical protein